MEQVSLQQEQDLEAVLRQYSDMVYRVAYTQTKCVKRRGGCVSGGFPAICEEKSGLCQRGTPQGVAFESNRQLLQKIMALGLAA